MLGRVGEEGWLPLPAGCAWGQAQQQPGAGPRTPPALAGGGGTLARSGCRVPAAAGQAAMALLAVGGQGSFPGKCQQGAAEGSCGATVNPLPEPRAAVLPSHPGEGTPALRERGSTSRHLNTTSPAARHSPGQRWEGPGKRSKSGGTHQAPCFTPLSKAGWQMRPGKKQQQLHAARQEHHGEKSRTAPAGHPPLATHSPHVCRETQKYPAQDGELPGDKLAFPPSPAFVVTLQT